MDHCTYQDATKGRTRIARLKILFAVHCRALMSASVALAPEMSLGADNGHALCGCLCDSYKRSKVRIFFKFLAGLMPIIEASKQARWKGIYYLDGHQMAIGHKEKLSTFIHCFGSISNVITSCLTMGKAARSPRSKLVGSKSDLQLGALTPAWFMVLNHPC